MSECRAVIMMLAEHWQRQRRSLMTRRPCQQPMRLVRVQVVATGQWGQTARAYHSTNREMTSRSAGKTAAAAMMAARLLQHLVQR